MKSLSRVLLALAFLLALLVLVPTHQSFAAEFASSWSKSPDRNWAGPAFWANRLQDWEVKDGQLVNTPMAARLPLRTVHLLTHRLDDSGKGFQTQIEISNHAAGAMGKLSPGGSAGLLLGTGRKDRDYRATAIVQLVPGPGAGLYVGIDAIGRLFVRNHAMAPGEGNWQLARSNERVDAKKIILQVTTKKATAAGMQPITVAALNPTDNKVLKSLTVQVPAKRLTGGLALVGHNGASKPAAKWGFQNWKLSGPQVVADNTRTAGPILCTQYTLSRGVMKLTAQLLPIGKDDNKVARLEVQQAGQWKQIAETKVIVPGFTAPFRIADWDDTKDTPYRVAYDLKNNDGTSVTYTWGGTIRRDPVDKETLVVAGFTGNHNNAHTLGRNAFNWNTGMWFPHEDLTQRVAQHKPDVLFFSGDQVYEGRSPTFADAANIKLDYLYKWYLWCWAYRDLARDIPTICIPDDHDVYQGNIWGEGGRKTNKDDKGGYVRPADFVKMVERTQTSHLPDPFDPTPVGQGIGVYYSPMTYGRISFAILEDRKFKSGCNGRVVSPGTRRADHIVDPKFDSRKADIPGLKLLGDRQLKFLNAWAADWRGADMKMALSQTHFANMATHHGPSLQYLIADLDSNGWPQTGRDKAVAALRRGFAFHLCGDQHLATIVQHGIANHNDAIWAFCVPSIANFYPRMWQPKVDGKNRPAGAPGWMGEHKDGLQNLVTVYAATNPGPKSGKEPALLHDRMPGYGIVRLNKPKRTITMECWPRYADPAKDKPYPGWPMTINQLDNEGRKPVGFLPKIQVAGMKNPVVQLYDSDKSLVYALRISGDTFQPMVFAEGKYTVKVGDPDAKDWKTFADVEAVKNGQGKTIQVEF